MLEDAIDRDIVRLLANDGRMTYADLGRRTGLSISAAHQRVRRLEQRRIIVGYTATINPAAVGLPISAFVALTDLQPEGCEALAALAATDEVSACYTITGAASYLLHVHLADLPALDGFLRRLRGAVGAISTTMIVLATHFSRPPTPVSPLVDTGPHAKPAGQTAACTGFADRVEAVSLLAVGEDA